MCSTVLPFVSWMLGSAPLAMSKRTHSSCPRQAANPSGYSPQYVYLQTQVCYWGPIHTERQHWLSCWCLKQQECIPVGCVPSAAVAVSPGGGVCLSECWEKHHPQDHAPPFPRDQAPPRDQAHPPSCGQIYACENITFTTSLRTVNILVSIAPFIPNISVSINTSFKIQLGSGAIRKTPILASMLTISVNTAKYSNKGGKQ